MSTEVMIISAAAWISEASWALPWRNAVRTALRWCRTAQRRWRGWSRGLVLLDSMDEEAGRVLVQQLQETKPGLAIQFTPQAAGVEAALEKLQPS